MHCRRQPCDASPCDRRRRRRRAARTRRPGRAPRKTASATSSPQTTPGSFSSSDAVRRASAGTTASVVRSPSPTSSASATRDDVVDVGQLHRSSSGSRSRAEHGVRPSSAPSSSRKSARKWPPRLSSRASASAATSAASRCGERVAARARRRCGSGPRPPTSPRGGRASPECPFRTYRRTRYVPVCTRYARPSGLVRKRRVRPGGRRRGTRAASSTPAGWRRARRCRRIRRRRRGPRAWSRRRDR